MEVVMTVLMPVENPQDAAEKVMMFEASPENLELGVKIRRTEIMEDGKAMVIQKSQ